MKILLWTFVALAGLITSGSEMIYVHYIAGEEVGNFTLIENGTSKSNTLDIAEDDFPVRLNLEIWGARNATDLNSFATIKLKTGGKKTEDTIAYPVSFNKNDDVGNVALRKGSFTLRPSQVVSRFRTSKFIENATPGIWSLSAEATDEDGVQITHIETVVRKNSRAMNWTIAGPGLALLGLGFIMLVQALRTRYPQFAS